MSIIVAIDISGDQATLVTGEAQPTGPVSIIDVRQVPLNGHAATASDDTDAVAGEEATAERASLDELLDTEVDASLALVPSQNVLFERMVLPFKDSKALEQVVPLQVQDAVPFDLDEFVVDSLVLGESDGGFEVLASVIPQQDVERTLKTLESLGADPKVLTTRASAISSLAHFFPQDLQGSYTILLFSNTQCSVAIFHEDELRLLREFPGSFGDASAGDVARVIRDVRSSIAKVEIEYNTAIERVFVAGVRQVAERASGGLTERRVVWLDFSPSVPTGEGFTGEINELSWALGLFANEAAKSTRKLVNFRRGRFAYRPALGNLLSALREEMFYLALALFLALTWFGTVVYSSYAALQKVEERIDEALQQTLPGEAVPELRENDFLSKRLGEIEEQLRSLGSLSPLSPLESLKELSRMIGADVDIEIEAINIGHTGITFRGSVRDFPSVGRLEAVLERNTESFCKVQVNSGNKVPGSSRVKFQAEVSFCE